MRETILSNAMVVATRIVVDGSLLLNDEFIAAIEHHNRHQPESIDCRYDFIFPGLIDLYAANPKQRFSPRQDVRWPSAMTSRRLGGKAVTPSPSDAQREMEEA